MEKAIVKRVIGPVVDVHFPEGQLPELYHAVEVRLPQRKVVMEVVQQIGGGDIRCIALSSTFFLKGISVKIAEYPRFCARACHRRGDSIPFRRGFCKPASGRAAPRPPA